jgi:hypothetical protein
MISERTNDSLRKAEVSGVVLGNRNVGRTNNEAAAVLDHDLKAYILQEMWKMPCVRGAT